MTTLFPLTVTQITAYIKRLLDGDDALRAVWLEGEVSNFKRHAPSGHCYFTLKDASAAIPCVMWRTAAQQLPRLPVDGEQVEAFGSVSVYETQGRYQFYVDRMTWAGVGRLHEQLERLKARLAAEGLFDPERKRPLPPWPRRVGVVTSAQAAALRDILRTLAWRYPLVEVLLAPAAVQGVEAPAQLVQAIGLLNTWAATVEPVDVIIVARGPWRSGRAFRWSGTSRPARLTCGGSHLVQRSLEAGRPKFDDSAAGWTRSLCRNVEFR